MNIRVLYSALDHAREHGCSDDQICAVLNNLCTEHFYGHHLVYLDRGTISYITENTAKFSHQAQRAKQQIKTDFAKLGGLKSVLPLYVEVNKWSGATHRAGKTLAVPMEFFAGADWRGATNLHLEGHADEVALLSLVAAVAHLTRAGRIKVRYRFQAAGGANAVHEVSRYKADATRIGLIVLDSDRIEPDGRLGETAAAVLREESKSPAYHLLSIAILDAHEIENLLPHELLQRVAQSTGNVQLTALCSLLAKLSTSIPSRAYELFLDLKNGHSDYNARQKTALSSNTGWWSSGDVAKLRQLGSLPVACPMHTCGAQSCNCILVPGGGSSLLALVGKELRRNSPLQTFQKLSHPQRNALVKVAEVVQAWCCGGNSLRL